MDFFAEPRPAGGERSVALCLGPLELEIGGLEPALAETLLKRYAPYSTAAASSGSALRVRVGVEPTDYFIDPPEQMEFVPVRIACDGARVRYLSYRVAGWFDTVGGEGQLLLAGGDFEPPERAMENYIRAAVAWQAACRGGGLVHAASAVWKDRGYLFYGESGAGKSTLAACNQRARIVSDDLSLVLRGEDGPVLTGSPFRGTYQGGPPVVGAFPVRAGFRLVQAPEAAVLEIDRPRALSELVGNLPFVAEAFSVRPDLFDSVEQTFFGLPLAHLHFRKDDSFWDAIEAAGY
jgi:hypothetical protein